VYNLRYHIASLVAVFLALAMGLLLGSIVVERGVLSDQQTALVTGLQRDFNEIRTESAALKAQNDALTAFATEAAPALEASALAGRTVLVIAAPESGDTVASVNASVRRAGGRTAVVTFTGPGLSLSDAEVTAAAVKTLGLPEGSVDQTVVVTALAREWSTPNDPRALTKALAAAGGLKLTGLPASATVDAVAVTVAFAGTPDPAAFALVRALRALRAIPAVGVETLKSADGTAVAAKAAGFSGVDDIDGPLGSVSLVWVLSGRASGLYGVGDTVDGAYPAPLFAAP
jgi:hypothetical protein